MTHNFFFQWRSTYTTMLHVYLIDERRLQMREGAEWLGGNDDNDYLCHNENFFQIYSGGRDDAIGREWSWLRLCAAAEKSHCINEYRTVVVCRVQWMAGIGEEARGVYRWQGWR